MSWYALFNVVVGQIQIHVHLILPLLRRLGLALVRPVLAQTQLHHPGPWDDFCDDGAQVEKRLSSSRASTPVHTLVTFGSLKSRTQGFSLVCFHVCQII